MVRICDGDPDSLEMQMYREQVRSSRSKYWKNQKQKKLNKPLKKALKKEGADKSYIKKARFIPVEYCIRGFHHSTDVIVFSDDDFKEIDFAFDMEVDVDRYIDGLTAGINPKLLNNRPVLSPPSEGKITTPIKVLSKGYWGFFSDTNVMCRKEEASEVWQYKAEVSAYSGNLHFGFYAKREDGKLGWVYFQVKPEDKQKLEKLLE